MGKEVRKVHLPVERKKDSISQTRAFVVETGTDSFGKHGHVVEQQLRQYMMQLASESFIIYLCTA